jgi:hypothetical protein
MTYQVEWKSILTRSNQNNSRASSFVFAIGSSILRRQFKVLCVLINCNHVCPDSCSYLRGDVVNDATVHWPAERKVVELGTIALANTVANHAHEQKQIIFDPIPRLDGIEPSDDPLLELRAAVYLISGRRRRTAPEQ